MKEKKCLACGFIVEVEDGVRLKQCPCCRRFYDKVEAQVKSGKSFTDIAVNKPKTTLTRLTSEPSIIVEPLSASKECPFCSELIKEAAKKCKHCGELLDGVLRAADENRQPQNVFMNSSSASAAVAVTETRVETGTKNFPHLLHFILTIVTGGLWLIVWLIHYLVKGRY